MSASIALPLDLSPVEAEIPSSRPAGLRAFLAEMLQSWIEAHRQAVEVGVRLF